MKVAQWLTKLGIWLNKQKGKATEGLETCLMSQIAAFTMKTAPFDHADYQLPMQTFWEQTGLLAPELASVMLDLLQINPTEASVERQFKVESDVWTADRNRLAPETRHAIMFVAMNYRILSGEKISCAATAVEI